MALEFPWAAFSEAQRRKDQNRQQMYQDMANIGKGFGEGFNTIGQAMQRAKQQKQWSKTINDLMNDPNINNKVKKNLTELVAKKKVLVENGMVLPQASLEVFKQQL